jgi:hypothetical protein
VSAVAPTPRWRGLAPYLALPLLAALAVVPYAGIFGLYPVGPDVPLWVHDMEPANPEWFANVFLRRQFIAWRPITALTFTLDGALGGLPLGMRVVDVGAHVLAGFAMVSAWRGLVGPAARPSPWWGVLAAALLWYSPLAELVVPFVTRRSYTLAGLFSFLAFGLGVWAIRAQRPLASVGAAALVALAATSNETGFVVGPALLLATALLGPSLRTKEGSWLAARHAAPLVLAVTAVLAARQTVLEGEVGGYDEGINLVAIVVKGEATFIKKAPLTTIFAYAWRGGVFPDDLSGDPMFVFGLGHDGVVGAVFGAWALTFVIRRAVFHRDLVPAVLAVWITGYALLAVLGHVWFPRMGYAMGGAVVLWVVWALRETATSAPSRWRLLDALVLALVLATRVQRATPLRGIERRSLREQVLGTRTIEESLAAVSRLEGPALVWVGVPMENLTAASVWRWVERLGPEGIEVRQLTHLVVPERPQLKTTVEFAADSVRPTPEAEWARQALDMWPTAPTLPLELYRLAAPDGRPTWILDNGRLTRIDEGAAPPP